METRYYKSFDDDFSFAENQGFQVGADYPFIKEKTLQKLFSSLIYPPFVLFGYLYTRFVLKIRIVGKEKLKEAPFPYFIFSNHTQPIGDAFLIPRLIFPRRVNVMISPANLSIPILGRLLPYLGGMPLSNTIKGLASFNSAFEKQGKKRVSVIFPEAHVWEYCEAIRPFKASAFSYPIKFNQPSFTLTVTYRKSRFTRRPRAIAYIDGPFYPDTKLSCREGRERLCNEIRQTMEERAVSSNAEYILYKPCE